MDVDTEQLLQSAIAAARGGDRVRARQMLTEVIKRNPNYEEAWLWLAGVIDDPARQRWCLEQVLVRNPNHPKARQAMAWLDQHQPPSPSPPPSSAPPPGPEPAGSQPTALTPEPTRSDSGADGEKTSSLPSSLPAPSRLSQLRAARMPQTTEQTEQQERQERQDGKERQEIAQKASRPLIEETELSLQCPYCGKHTTINQRVCPACNHRLIEPVFSYQGNTPALSFLGGMWGAVGFFTLAIGYAMLDRSNTFFVPFALGAVTLGMAVAVLRRHRWAYLAIGMATIPLMFFSWKHLFWPLLIPLVVAYIRSYRDFFPRTRRMVPRLVEGDHEEHHKAATFYQDLEMWYLAAQEWQAALLEEPRNLTYRRGLARALLELEQLEKISSS